MKNIGVLLSGGTGTRFGGKTAKQYLSLNGREMISYVIDAFRATKNMDDFVVVVGHDEIESGRIRDTYGVNTVEGGSTRGYSFGNAMDYIANRWPECEKVVIHEAARPLVGSETFSLYYDLLDTYDYVESCKKVIDSIGSYKEPQPVREDFYLIQAPEAYRFPLLREYYDPSSKVYYAAHQLPKTSKGFQYFDIPFNWKVTFPEDIDIVTAIMQVRDRKGTGTR